MHRQNRKALISAAFLALWLAPRLNLAPVNLEGEPASRSPFQRPPDSTPGSPPSFLGRDMIFRPATEGAGLLGSPNDRFLAAGRGAYPPIVTAKPRSPQYLMMQKRLARGWNTWNTNSVLSHVLLPEGFAVNFCLHGSVRGYLATAFKTTKREEKVSLGPHAEDGSYTSLDIDWDGNELNVQSGHDGADLVVLVTVNKYNDQSPSTIPNLVVESGMLWNRPGEVKREADMISARIGESTITVRTTAPLFEDKFVFTPAPYLAVKLKGEIGITTGEERTLAEIKTVLEKQKSELNRQALNYGDLADFYEAIRNVMAWNIIYDPEKDRVIFPVNRYWNYIWAGYVYFGWDSYFEAYMLSLYNKNLAFAAAVEITKEITPSGFIPNWAGSYGRASFDHSHPPVGSLMVREIYRRHPEKWFLEEVYDELLTWNRWWPEQRANREWLSWGSDAVPADVVANTLEGAIRESGLDNSPMYDGQPFNKEKSIMELADVGLTSLYVADGEALAEIADVLGKGVDALELRERAAAYRKALAGLWHEGRGIYMNKRTDTNRFSSRLSPTNFYALLAKAPTQRQAERMTKEHYFNPQEFYGEFVMPSIARNDPAFKDNTSWRGRIWAPLNFLVYLGMRNYGLDEARQDLAKKSRDLLLKSWRGERAVYENYNAVTGRGGDVPTSESFSTWGGLLGMIDFIEKGFVGKPEEKIR